MVLMFSGACNIQITDIIYISFNGFLLWTTIISGYLTPHVRATKQVSQIPKVVLGIRLPMDEESMFRYPNQSELCHNFIRTFCLDTPSLNDFGMPKQSPWDIRQTSSWFRHRQRNKTPIIGTSKSDLDPEHSNAPMSFEPNLCKGQEQQQPPLYTFTSPLYPNVYPSQLDCIKVIRAPSENQRVVLNFRGPFVVEPSTGCVNDYLEVRDGQFGFSPMIGRFCTDSWQLRAILSSGRWMWLRFHADYTIEKSGFQAIFHYDQIPQIVTVEAIITVETGGVLDTRNLSQLLHNKLKVASESGAKRASRLQEMIIDFRSIKPSMTLLLHLSFIKFPLIDPDCKYNLIEIYDKFFLLDREKRETSSGTSGGTSKLMRRRRRPTDIQSTMLTRVMRGCNQPELPPSVHTLGRGVVRILSSSAEMLRDTQENTLQLKEEGTRKNSTSALLPEMTLVYTSLMKAPCERDWMPCSKLHDLNVYKDKLNSSGLSLADLLIKPSEMGTQSNQNISDKLASLSIGSIYCVHKSFICDNLTNCPNGEDEDECPRNSNTLDQLILEHSHAVSVDCTDRKSTVSDPTTTEKTTEGDDEFAHHTSIIVGLLGFCAICGLISAGMTLINRSGHMKRNRLSGICNKVFFDPEPTMETKSVLRLKSSTSEPHNLLCEGNSVEFVDAGHTPASQSSISCDDHKNNDATVKTEKRSCLVRLSTRKKESPLTNIDPSVNQQPPNSNTDSSNQHHDVGINSRQVPSEAKYLNEIFDRANKQPVGYVKTINSSPIRCIMKPSHSSSSSMYQQQQQKQRQRNIQEFKQKQSLLRNRPSRSAAASFGNLPNTSVFPVERLTETVYHSYELGGPGGHPNKLNRSLWSRSGPLPLMMNESDQRSASGQSSANHLLGTHSAKCLSRKSSIDNRDEMNTETEFVEFKVCQPFNSVAAKMPNHIAYNTEVGILPQYSTGNCVIPQDWCMANNSQRKHFKGGAPKRPRYSVDPSNEPECIPTTIDATKCRHDDRTPIHHPRYHKEPVMIQNTYPWTSSRSTSGELIENSSYSNNNNKRTISNRTKASAGWTSTLNGNDLWGDEKQLDHQSVVASDTDTDESITEPNSPGYPHIGESADDTGCSGNGTHNCVQDGPVYMTGKLDYHYSPAWRPFEENHGSSDETSGNENLHHMRNIRIGARPSYREETL